MMGYIDRVRDAVRGYRTILTAVATILAGVAAWSAGEEDLLGLIAIVGVALEAIFLRLGLKNEAGITGASNWSGAYAGAAEAVAKAAEEMYAEEARKATDEHGQGELAKMDDDGQSNPPVDPDKKGWMSRR